MDYSNDFTFPVHSGFGNQYQQLLPALFLAQATGRRVILPPLLAFSSSLSSSAALNVEMLHLAQRSCSRGESDFKKQHLVDQSERQFGRVCDCSQQGICSGSASFRGHVYHFDLAKKVPRGPLVQWNRVYNLTGFPHRERTCDERRLCGNIPDRAMHATLMNRFVPAANGWCNDSQPGESSPTCGEQLWQVHHLAVNSSAPLCLGPLNTWWLVRVLEKCSHSFPTARALLHFGLPLHGGLREWLRLHFEAEPQCDLCVYIRLTDKDNNGTRAGTVGHRRFSGELQRSLHPSALARAGVQGGRSIGGQTGGRIGGQMSGRRIGGPNRGAVGGSNAASTLRVEVVSNCRPSTAACVAASSAPQQVVLPRHTTFDAGTHPVRSADGETTIRLVSDGSADGRDATMAALRAVTGLGPQTASELLDQVRCARCEHIMGAPPEPVDAQRASARSSFYEEIERLHARFRMGSPFGEVALRALSDQLPKASRDLLEAGFHSATERQQYIEWNTHLLQRQAAEVNPES